MYTSFNHITVCICTYKRPYLLDDLLIKLSGQITNRLFSFSIVVVDNDREKSAEKIVTSNKKKSNINIEYYCEPEQNISLARNKAIKNAKGDFIAFIDDDEFPINDWLLKLYQAYKKYSADGILGPVIPYYETTPPSWIQKGKFYEYPSHCSGHTLRWTETRTGNVLMRKKIIIDENSLFNPVLGSGGEDRDFFRRLIQKGYSFIWYSEAPVYELVPTECYKIKFLLRRALLRGKVSIKNPTFRTMDIFKSVLAISLYTPILPILFLIRFHVFIKFLIKDFDHIGRLIAFCGLDLIKRKYISK